MPRKKQMHNGVANRFLIITGKKKGKCEKMDYKRISKLHHKIFSTPQNSREREQAMSVLSDADRAAVYDYDMGRSSGRIKEIEINEQEENGNMTYEQYANKMESDKKGTIQEISQFAMKSPETYRQYREQYMKEQQEELALRNRQLTENTFKNKPYSMR